MKNIIKIKKQFFINYNKKWGLTNFRFFINTRKRSIVYIIRKDRIGDFIDLRIGKSFFEISSIDTLIKQFNMAKEIKVYEGHNPQVFNSAEEFKRYLLIIKISGV